MNSFLRSESSFRHGELLVGFIFLLFARGLALAFSAAPLPYASTEWHSDHGLPHDSVHSVIQARDGYIWIGTRRGVVRFDGVRFVTPKVFEGKNDNISTVLEDSTGDIWFGTARGLMRLKNGNLIHYGAAEGIATDDVRTIFEGADGSIWIGRAGGLTRFKEGKFRNFNRSDGLPHSVVRSICEDESGTLWIGTDGGLCIMRNEVISLPEGIQFPGTSVRIVYLDPTKRLWVGTQNGLYRRNDNGQWEHSHKGDGLADDFVDALHWDRKGQLWIGTYGGLNRLVAGRLVTEMTSEGIGYDLVNCMIEDREGNIWIGSKEGVARLKPRPFTAITRQEGLAYNNVMSVLQDKTGTVWGGTWGGGLFQLQNGRAISLTNQIGNNRILALCEGRDGSLWIGTDYDGGLYRLKEGIISRVGEDAGLERIAIRAIHEDREGSLWIGTARSLVCLRDGQAIHYRRKDGLAGDAVKVIFEDKEGDLWIGTNEGLSRRTNGRFTNFTTNDGLSHNIVVALYQDQQDTLWIGTSGGGLNRYRDNRFTSYTTAAGLFNNDVLEILEDDQGYLWMSCLKGIFRVQKKSIEQFDRREIPEIPCTAYGKEDGLVSIICGNVAKPAGWKGTRGELWFPTTKGLVVTDSGLKQNDLPPPVVIEEIVADKKRARDHAFEHKAEREFAALETVHLPPGRGEWEIHYTALSFQAPEKNRFKYKLEGVDPDWVEADTRRVAYYNNILPGSYTFRVVACNNNGVWNTEGAKLMLTLQPFYWQTLWFKSLIAAGCFSLVAGTARYATKKRMELKLERIQQQHAIERERTRIAKDIHDDLGASLTRITFLGELAETDKAKPESVENYVQRIVVTARETVRSLDEIVWAVNPQRDTLNSLVEYVAHYSNEFLEGTHIRCRLDLPDLVPDISLSSEVRHSLFLVIKEFLNNTVKHAGASEVTIRMELSDGSFVVEVRDNGCGFDSSALPTSGVSNGLGNMRKRLEHLDARVQLESVPGCGTRLWFKLKLARIACRTRDLQKGT